MNDCPVHSLASSRAGLWENSVELDAVMTGGVQNYFPNVFKFPQSVTGTRLCFRALCAHPGLSGGLLEDTCDDPCLLFNTAQFNLLIWAQIAPPRE